MDSNRIRTLFLDYYVGKGHTHVPSASLIPSSYDPSVLLTTAGMQPLKPYFLGESTPPASRLTSCQKCFRTPDIDEVGNTARHLTFFEMLGNFSFGDYFKQGAIEMAWEFLTEGLGLQADRLWATVHRGDDALGLGVDEEAVEHWLSRGIPRERIVELGEDNFWKAGPTGPCGPCSEIYFDRGAEHGCGQVGCLPGCNCDRYLEFYNLVFMQFDRSDAGILTPLPKQNIDTGMGLERISALMQGNVSVFEIDSFRSIIGWAEQASGIRYGDSAAATKALRVLADHGRGMTFLASDGVIPSNEGRGYVLRRVIRRAIQQADRIGLYGGDRRRTGGILEAISAKVVETFGEYHPNLVSQRSDVVAMLVAEEERFLATLTTGSGRLSDVITRTTSSGVKVLAGDEVFQLHDTYGFPVELTAELAGEQGLSIDRDRFDELMREQRDRARAAAAKTDLPPDVIAAFARSAPATAFVGWGAMEERTRIVAFDELPDEGGHGGRVLIKLASSPLYAEGGGQVSDAGMIAGPGGGAVVEHVLRFEDDQVLVARMTDGTLAVGDDVTVRVDAADRRATEGNHTATHLLHRALRERLGEHVRQAGSLVAPDRLRFDFTHTSGLTTEDIEAIERTVNEEIAAGDDVDWSILPIDEARDRGAMMLFGEKYGDEVRLVDVGRGWSRELCGGTHVANTAQIRLFVIVSESSVGANTRRIEAVTGDGAIRWLRRRAEAGVRAAAAANVDVDQLPDRVDELVRHARQLERELTVVRGGSGLESAVAAAELVDGINLVVHRDDSLGGDELMELSDRVRNRLAPAVVLLASAAEGKVSFVAGVSDEAVAKGVRAGDIVKAAAAVAGGGGGGRPTMARAGGKDPTKVDEALVAGRRAVHDALSATVS